MNQILYVEGKGNMHSIDIKKIILFFAISILLFGIILLGEGSYSIYQKMINAKVTPSTPDGSGTTVVPTVAPTIFLTQTADQQIIIHIESETAISHILYAWNNETPNTIEEKGKTTIEEVIDLPTGENELNLSVIDINGVETKEKRTFTLEISKPNIELSVIGDKIKITVSSQTDLSYVTYKWNSEQEHKENMNTYQDKTKYETTLEIPKGQNTLKITAVDTSENQSEKSQEIKGVTKAKTSVVANGKYLEFTVQAEEDIKAVQYTLNGNTFLMNTETFGKTNTVFYKVEMIEGMNYLKIISVTNSDAVDTTIWKYEYKPQS